MDAPQSHIQAAFESPGHPNRQPDPALDPNPLLSALREAADHESYKEELVGGKTRSAVAMAGAYFAVVQTATFSASGTLGELHGSGRSWTVGLAMGAMGILAITIALAVWQQWPKEHKSFASKQIGQDLTDLLNGTQSQRAVVYQLAKRYAAITKSRLITNTHSVKRYYATAAFGLLAVLVTTSELAVSLLTRI